MPSTFDDIVSYFERDGWKFRRLSGHDAMEMGVAGEAANYRLVAVGKNQRPILDQFYFTSHRASHLPPGDRAPPSAPRRRS